MDEQTAFVLAIQLLALFSIAGALLLYLLCKISNQSDSVTFENIPGAGKPILITSADNAMGLQLAIHLASRGFRVFSGLKDGAGSGCTTDSVSAKVIRSWQKERESQNRILQGSIVALPFDVTREDILHEASSIIRAHLPAGEDGLWAVINTTGIAFKGRLDQQNINQWDTMLKTNVVGLLRVARAFQGLLRNTNGRIISFGPEQCTEAGLVAYAASRYAVQGASAALRKELHNQGIKVITVNPTGFSSDLLFANPKLKKNEEHLETSEINETNYQYYPVVLTAHALHILDVCITSKTPKENYCLRYKYPWSKPLDVLTV